MSGRGGETQCLIESSLPCLLLNAEWAVVGTFPLQQQAGE